MNNIPLEEMPRELDRLLEEIERLNNAIDRAIAFIEQNLLPSHNIKNTDWEFEEVIYSDLPVGVIKPLIDILKEVNK